MTSKLNSFLLQLAYLASRDFLLFVELGFSYLYPGQTLAKNWHLEVLAELARKVVDKETRYQMVALSPRSLKSFIFSVCLPAYLLGRYPGMRILCASYGSVLACQHSADCRKIMMSDWYALAFPKTKISPSKSTEIYFETTENGSRRAVSAEGAVTGLGGDAIIADDLVSANDAHNLKVHQDRTDWFFRSLLTRLNVPNKGIVLVIGQRLHIEDPMAQIAHNLQMDVLSIPAIAQVDCAYDLGGGQSHTFKAGEVLHEALLNRDELNARLRAMGRADFHAQYLQDPLPDGGGALDFSMHKRFEKLPASSLIFHSWDVARTPGGGDYTVGAKFGYADDKFYLIDIYRVQLDVTQVVRFIDHKMKTDKPAWSIIETADGSGDAVHRTLAREYGYTNIERYHPRKSKEDRFYEIVPMIQAGDVLIPTSGPWVPGYRSEFMAFPNNGKGHDDQLDAVSQFLRCAPDLIRKAGGVRPKSHYRNPPEFRLISLGGRRRLVDHG
jgi:predicted phage terminase large subunit-like protein